MSVTSKIEVALVDRPVDVESLAAYPAEAGGECLFVGRTRHEHDATHGDLEGLTYEAFRPMAERVLDEIARDAATRFGCQVVRVRHALGDVPIGAGSVLVQVACGHRAEAFEACRFVIDELKLRVPIWKRERWHRGVTWSPGTVVPTPETT